MTSFTIPAIFTGVDRLTGTMRQMGRGVDTFARRTEGALARSERMFRRITPSMGAATKQLLSFASTASLMAAGAFSAKAIMDYETEIASLSAITGTSGKDLEIFKSKIMEVATATGKSSVEVAKAFTMIGNNSPDLLKDAAGLAEVTKQSIILAQASKMELAPSADYLTQIMNQFNEPAQGAKKTIDLLAGAMVLGSTDINAVAESMTTFGGVASQVAGTSMEESIVAIETISNKMKDASKIGNQFKNMFLVMSAIRVQDPKAMRDLKTTGVNLDIVRSKTAPLIDKLTQLKKLLKREGALEHVFGKENVQALVPLLTQTDKYRELMDKLTHSEDAKNAAQKMADKNNNTLAMSVERLTNKWINMLTGSEEASKGVDKLKSGIAWLTKNLDQVVSVAVSAVKWFLLIKGGLLLARGAMIAYNVVLGIASFRSASLVVGVGATNVALRAQAIATNAAIAAQWLWNASLFACPLIAVVAGVAALAAGIYYLNGLVKEYIDLQNQAFQKGANKASANVKQRIGMGQTKEKAITEEKKSVERQQKENQFQIEQISTSDYLFDKDKIKKLAAEKASLTQQATNLNAMQMGKLSVAGKNIMAPAQVDAVTGQTFKNENEKKFLEAFKPQEMMQPEAASTSDAFASSKVAQSTNTINTNNSKLDINIKTEEGTKVDAKGENLKGKIKTTTTQGQY